MTASVPPDREAAVQQVAEAMQYQFGGDHDYRDEAQLAADAFWPLICQAREDGKAEGRREVLSVDYDDYIAALRIVRARGAQQPDEKERTDGQ